MVSISQFDGLLISKKSISGLSGAWANELHAIKIAVYGDSALRSEYVAEFEARGAIIVGSALSDAPSALHFGVLDLVFIVGDNIGSSIAAYFLAYDRPLIVYDVDPGGVLTAYVPPQVMDGGSGNDTFLAVLGSAQINGHDGVDTIIYDGIRSAFAVSRNGHDLLVTKPGGTVDSLASIERVEFHDGALVFETSSNADFTYRMYTAAYFRTPDEAGFLYWTKVMDRPDIGGDGDLSYGDKLVLAREFLRAPEFSAIYGANASDETYIEKMYSNVLGRSFDQQGRDYWLGRMGDGAGRDEILTVFVDCAENLLNTAGDRDVGFWVL